MSKEQPSYEEFYSKVQNEEYRKYPKKARPCKHVPGKFYVSNLVLDKTFAYFPTSYVSSTEPKVDNHMYTVIGAFNSMCIYLSSKLDEHIFIQDSIWVLTALNLRSLDCYK